MVRIFVELFRNKPLFSKSESHFRTDTNYALRYVYLDEDQALFECKFQVTSSDPLQTIEVVLPMPSLPILKAGTYALELLCGDEPLGSHRIKVKEMKGEDDDN